MSTRWHRGACACVPIALVAVLTLVGCGTQHRVHPTAAPASSPTASAAVPASPSPTPPVPRPRPTSTSPDSLGAHRVIPVPKSLAQAQEHRIVPVDGQPVFLDSQPGAQPRPLLLVLAGLGEDAVTMRNGTGFTALGALSGFDVAYPEAPKDPPMPQSSPVARTPHATTVAVVTAHRTVASPQPMNSPALPSVGPPASPETTPTITATPTPSPSRSPGPSVTPTPTP